MSTAELATSYASLILADDGLEITVSSHSLFSFGVASGRVRSEAQCSGVAPARSREIRVSRLHGSAALEKKKRVALIGWVYVWDRLLHLRPSRDSQFRVRSFFYSGFCGRLLDFDLSWQLVAIACTSTVPFDYTLFRFAMIHNYRDGRRLLSYFLVPSR